MNRNKKILNVTMAAGMAAVLGTTPVIAAAQEADNGVSKEETVYVNATAEGEIKDITVSDWLKNSGSHLDGCNPYQPCLLNPVSTSP